MHNNFNRKTQEKFEECKFVIAESKKTLFKTVNGKDGKTHDLFEFWVLDNGNEVHCIAWDNVAHDLKKVLDSGKTNEISLTFKKRLNKFTEKIDYSVREFKI